MTQKENNSKQKKISNKNNGEKPQNAYFLSLELENVRCFGEKQIVNFSDENNKPKRWTIILGNNGTGKTTILQSLIGLTPTKKRDENVKNIDGFYNNSKVISDLSFDWNLKRNNNEKSLLISLRYNLLPRINALSSDRFIELIDIKIESKIAGVTATTGRMIKEESAKAFFCLGYGASRKAGETSLSEYNEESSYKTLFDETSLLINPEEWLLQADYASKRSSKFKTLREKELIFVKDILIKILPDIDGIRFTEKESGRNPQPIVEFQTKYGWVEAKDLSLGYRTSMAWIVDFASRMFDRYSESENPLAEPAVVLIDEIDLHLHPKWQRDLLPWLSDLFPNTQFIVTTHSPLIVQSAVARDANIVVCRREGDHVVIDQSVEAVKNWRADQILTSDFFGLETARPKEIEKDLFERQEILSKAKLTKKDEKRLKELEENIGSMPVMENPEDDKAMDIIRRAAERLQSQK